MFVCRRKEKLWQVLQCLDFFVRHKYTEMHDTAFFHWGCPGYIRVLPSLVHILLFAVWCFSDDDDDDDDVVRILPVTVLLCSTKKWATVRALGVAFLGRRTSIGIQTEQGFGLSSPRRV